jgi:hypothetical protein
VGQTVAFCGLPFGYILQADDRLPTSALMKAPDGLCFVVEDLEYGVEFRNLQ